MEEIAKVDSENEAIRLRRGLASARLSPYREHLVGMLVLVPSSPTGHF